MKKKKFNIDYALNEVVYIKNNTFCRVIKSTPNEISFKKFTEEEISKINKNMLNSQKFSNIYKNTFDVGEKVLINENFKIDNKTLKRRNKKMVYGILMVLY